MSLFDDASLVLTPNGVKSGKVYSIKPTDGVGDFDFTRASSATRVNSDGLIETVSTGVPRLDYPPLGGCPSLLLEPLRTNLVSKSEDINTWSNQNSPTVTANDTISPDGGLNADKITSTVLNSAKFISVNTVNATIYSISVFVKNVNSQRSRIEIYNSPACVIEFNWVNDSPYTHSVTTFTNVGYEYYGDGWWRITANFTATGTSNGFYIYPDRVVGTNSIYAWGAQLEAGTYATSYIPTTSAISTRSAETCNGAGDASTFNDSEGVLFAEISALANDGTSRRISLSNGGTSQRVSLEVEENANDIQAIVVSTTSQVGMVVSLPNVTLYNKIAFKYKKNDFAIWGNGFELDTDLIGITPVGLSELAFDDGVGNNDFYGKTKQVITFKEALTDAELEYLTSYRSFNEMATSQLYTIE